MTPSTSDLPGNDNSSKLVPLAVSLSPGCRPTICLEDLLAHVLRESMAATNMAHDAPPPPIHSLTPLFERHECLMVLLPEELVAEVTAQCGDMHLVCERLDQLVSADHHSDPANVPLPDGDIDPSAASPQGAQEMPTSELAEGDEGSPQSEQQAGNAQKYDNQANNGGDQ